MTAETHDTSLTGQFDRPRRLMFRCGRRSFFLSPDDVSWIEGQGNYSRVHTARASFLVREVIGAITARMEPFGFARVHRSAVVNVSRILELRRKTRYTHVIVLADGVEVPLAPDYRERLERLLLEA